MKKKYWFFAGLAVVGLFVLWFVVALNKGTKNAVPEWVMIPEGARFVDVVDSLDVHGCMPNKTLFTAMSSMKNYGKRIKSGAYRIEPGTKVVPLFRMMYSGRQTPIKLTIVKHRTRRQLCDYLSEKLSFSSEEMMKVMSDDSLMGYIIPNTYEVYWNVTPQKLLNRLHREWDVFWSGARAESAERMGLTPMEVMTLASIVEEETNQKEEKPLVASVYLNRLRKGMLLQADPTVRYAVGDFGLRRILLQHTMVDSPYNTYLYKGLPPAPICTPSVESIEAVLKDVKSDYLYFCAKEDFSGSHNFASTLSRHNENAHRFHAALNKRGVK